jgi:hypothetical protein
MTSIGLPRRYPLTTYPYARDAAEDDYFRAVHYMASALYLFDARDEALRALRGAWQVVIDRQATELTNPVNSPRSV